MAALTGPEMGERAPGRPTLPAPPASPAAPCTVVVARREDVPRARRAARALAAAQGFGIADTESVSLAATELATNLVRYAHGGSLTLTPVTGPAGAGVQIESHDAGPGIADLARALQDGFSTGGGLGSGLPGLRRLMDEFAVESGAAGTTIVARKWPGRAPRGR